MFAGGSSTLFAVLSALLFFGSAHSATVDTHRDDWDGWFCVQNNTESAPHRPRLEPVGCQRSNYNECSDYSKCSDTITENSVVTYWSGLIDRTSDSSPYSWNSWKAKFAKDVQASKTQLTLYVDNRYCSASPAPASGATVNESYGVADCTAPLRATQLAYDTVSGFQPFLDANPHATSVPYAGVVFLSANNAGVVVPEGYLKVVSPHTPPYNVSGLADSLAHMQGLVHLVVVAGESDAPPTLVNITPLTHTVKATTSVAPKASSSSAADVVLPGGFAPPALAVALAALSFVI
ncbi:hypothetical protein HDU86_001056 [Geranomyces michiganensis]|nr:hypothetical protein HDU86_001056 [Geranomyces michiganensis]